MSYARSPRPDFSMTMGISWLFMFGKFGSQISNLRFQTSYPLHDLELVALRAPAEHGLSSAQRLARVDGEGDTERLQSRVRLAEVGHPQRHVPQPRLEPLERIGARPQVFGRHQLDHRPAGRRAVVADEEARRLLVVGRDDPHP